jgi:hypothetical protein
MEMGATSESSFRFAADPLQVSFYKSLIIMGNWPQNGPPALDRRVPRLPTMTANKLTRGQSVNSVPLTMDEVTELINNRRRRLILQLVNESAEEMSLDQLSRKMAAVMNDISIDEVSSDERKKMYVSLYQNHLPKLDDDGVIEYDKRAKTIDSSPSTSVVADLIRDLSAVCSDDEVQHSRRGVFDRLIDDIFR